MAIITDAEAEAGFQVLIRWFAKASQRYPPNENEFYFSSFPMLEPGQEFSLEDDLNRFVLGDINDDPEELEYTIRDLCYTQTFLPQFVGFTYWQPDFRQATTLTNIASTGDASITVGATNFMQMDNIDTPAMVNLAVNDMIVIGPRPEDLRVITSINGLTISFADPLTRTFPAGTAINLHPVVSLPVPGVGIIPYPDDTAAAGLARVLDNDGNLLTDTLEVNTPIFFDTGETVLRYYYDSALTAPVNGARGPGDTEDNLLTHNGQEIAGGWWAFGESDNTAANTSRLIDAQGFSLDTRARAHAFDLSLAFSDTENGACGSTNFTSYAGNHSNFSGIGSMGTTSIINVDGSSPPSGYYSWVSTLQNDIDAFGATPSIPLPIFVKFWDGTAFLDGIVGTGAVDNCPIALPNSVVATTFGTAQAIACNSGGTSRTLFYFPILGTSFSANNVSAIYTDRFGPSSDTPSSLASLYIKVGSSNFLWNGTTLIADNTVCVQSQFCGDPNALNTGSGDIRNDGLCVYARQTCTDPAANNFDSFLPARSTDVSNPGLCTYTAYTATLTLTGAITGPFGSFDTSEVLTSGGQTGESWSLSWSATLNEGFMWVSQPASFAMSGTFGANDESFSHDITGEVVAVVDAPLGCNNDDAVNFLEGSDGSQDCFFSLGDFSFATSGNAACDNHGFVGFEDSRTLVSSDGDSNIREFNTGTGERTGASGFYSDGSTVSQYSSGSLIGSATACPVAFRVTGASINAPAVVDINENFSVSGSITTLGIANDNLLPLVAGFSVSGGNTLLGSGTRQEFSGNSTPGGVVFLTRRGTYTITMLVLDGGSSSGQQFRISQQIRVV